jgi:hypothetical protein
MVQMWISRNLKLTRKQYMKNIKLLITFLIIGFTINISGQNGNGLGDTTGTLYAGGTVTAATASAKLLVAMALSQTTGLKFGSLVLNGSVASTVVYDPSSTDAAGRTFSTGVQASSDTGGNTPTLAVFAVTGSHSENYALTLPTSGEIDLTSTAYADSSDDKEIMTIDALKISFANKAYTSGSLRASTLDASGDDTITLGGTLNISIGQKAGTYTGTYEISVDYN